MKNIEDIVEMLDGILPKDAKKTVIFCEVEKTAYEIFYYAYFADDSRKQCYELADAGGINPAVLEKGFEKLAAFIRNCNEYDAEKRNVVTICVEGISEKVALEQFDKSIGLYKLKKDWKAANL